MQRRTTFPWSIYLELARRGAAPTVRELSNACCPARRRPTGRSSGPSSRRVARKRASPPQLGRSTPGPLGQQMIVDSHNHEVPIIDLMVVTLDRAVTTGPNTGLEDSSRGVRACSIEPQSWFQERRPPCGTAHFSSQHLPSTRICSSPVSGATCFIAGGHPGPNWLIQADR